MSYFTTRTWKFDNANFLELNNKIPETDRNDFNYEFKDADITEYLQNAAIGAQKYLFNIDYKRLSVARTIFRR